MHLNIAAFHISMIPARWYKNSYKNYIVSEENIVFSYKKDMHELNQNSITILSIHKPAIMPIIVSIMKNTIYKRQQYGQIWELASQSNAIDQTIKTPADDLDELSLSKMDETEESDNDTVKSVILNLANIKNPSYIVNKRRPLKRKYQSSIEQEQKQQKQSGNSIYRSYKRHLCSQTGHNSTFHKDKSRNNQTETHSS
ncbi:21114_t:CDS:2 [Cetraspora pellucida]|uniref:21114_t:CDS:1 n=1 Tax=Cetraspora pellucida TaxID=1433469 RepID=A0A9N9BVL8_9GLOM|nr:21114_t:CDS:2 [Cetraspora pellucida]